MDSQESSNGGGAGGGDSSQDFTKKRRLDGSGSNSDLSAPTSTSTSTIPTPSSSSAIVKKPPPPYYQSWQESKGSIKERTSCLVNSERLSDITFFIGHSASPIYGHKTILSAGSPYFEKLFFGPMAISENVHRIPDIEPEVFLAFLKYLYTDEFDESMDAVDAMLLLKPAKIFIVPHLANKCAELLIDKMSPENIFLIYNRAIVFDEVKLAEVCLRYLDRQIDKVIMTEEFLDIDRDTLCTLLQRDNLRINECILFKAVLRWSETECKRKDLEISPATQRDIIGKAIHLIRFPAMSREEFAIDVVPTSVLSKDEIISVFMNLCIGCEQKQYRPDTPFAIERRVYRPKLQYINRFADVLSKVIHFTSFCSGENVYNSSVKFRTDQRVFVNGVGIYAISSTITGLKFNSTVSLFKSRSVPSDNPNGNSSVTFAFGQLLGSRSMEGTSRNYDFRMPFQMMFDRPLEVRPDEEYSLNAVLKVVRESAQCSSSMGFPFSAATHSHASFGGYGNQIDAYYGTKSLANVYCVCTDGIKVNFTFPSISTSGESFGLGQIPQIIFSV